MTPRSKISAFLVRARTAIRAGHVIISDYAMEGAEGLGWDESDVYQQVHDLAPDDFLRCEDSHVHPWEMIWVFTPSLSEEESLWIRLVARNGIIVVSFHTG